MMHNTPARLVVFHVTQKEGDGERVTILLPAAENSFKTVYSDSKEKK
jgi:hypothetical protein